jgi:hypothetical protein
VNTTHRRINLVQAWKVSGSEWVTIPDLVKAGAYGSPRLIHKALMRMNAHQLVDLKEVETGKRGYLYRFTPQGLQRMGFIATKQGD